VIVKLYGIADASGVSVEELIAAYQDGASVGELFKMYGKPALVGVGHVRKDAANDEDMDGDDMDDEDLTGEEGLLEGDLVEGEEDSPGKDKDKDKGSQGICNAREKGGKANANGKDVDCGDDD
jgi:hypothetical protein